MKDYLIVGLGISSISFLSFLEERKYSYLVVDSNINCVSNIASGIINPIFIKYHKKVWQADRLYQQMKMTYGNIENELSSIFLEEKEIFKLLKNDYQRRDWLKYNDRLRPYVLSEINQNTEVNLIENSGVGNLTVNKLDFLKLKQEKIKILRRKNQLIQAVFEYEQLQITSLGFLYKGDYFDRVVFCEGTGIKNNPFFKDISILKNKGELLHIYAPKLNLNKILHTSVLIIPLGNHQYKIAATYDLNDDTECTTLWARQQLEDRLKKILNCDYEIIDQYYGFRPVTEDRRPVVGAHQEIDKMYMINGMGSRGMLTAPFICRALVDYIYQGKEISEDMSILRYYNQ